MLSSIYSYTTEAVKHESSSGKYTRQGIDDSEAFFFFNHSFLCLSTFFLNRLFFGVCILFKCNSSK